jgi:hypothetical protein
MRLLGRLVLVLLPFTIRASDDFKPIYNGSDLSSWHIKDSKVQLWQTRDEILHCEKGEKGENGGGWLTTDKEYGDFILKLEWRIPAGGNSGVGLRYPKEGEPAHEGMEIERCPFASATPRSP